MPIVMVGGGVDSTVLLYALHRIPSMFGVDPEEKICAVFMDNGMKVGGKREEFIRFHCDSLNVELTVKNLTGVWPDGARTVGRPPNSVSVPFLPDKPPGDPYWEEEYDYSDGQLMLYLTHACIEASNRGMKYVFLGFQLEKEEMEKKAAGFITDNSADFFAAFEELMDTGGFLPHRKPELRFPFAALCMSKAAVMKFGEFLKVPLDKTISCDYQYPPCQRCMSCVRRARGEEQVLNGIQSNV